MKRTNILLALVLIVAGFACKEPYAPPVVSSPNSYLVVEGVLNAGSGATTITLTKSFKLADTARLQFVRNAIVTVEGKDNTVRTLPMTAVGIYTSPNLGLVIGRDYRLRIKAEGKEYLSDFTTAVKTPEIDSIGWRQNEEGVRVYVNAHDASDDTRYYRWDYDETWEIRSYYYAEYKYVAASNTVSQRLPGEQVATCWKYNKSTTILLGSSAKLQSDVIFESPITSFLQGDEKLAVRYSILLRQYALNKESYDFYQMMKRTTETLGTIFDVQPSEIRGNIQCVSNPGELVIGYVTASTISEKRVFINNIDLKNWALFWYCPPYDVANNPDSFRIYFGGGTYSPYTPVYSPATGALVAYSSSFTPCVDCTSRGGSNVKPSYW